jgi:antitoxin (DNA-binding transcriptional repressor) of toxin-antitoxin stability system
MKHTLTVAQGQAQFPALCRKGKTSVITLNGKTVAYIMPQKWMAKLLQHLESMETLANSEAMSAIQRGKGRKTRKRR